MLTVYLYLFYFIQFSFIEFHLSKYTAWHTLKLLSFEWFIYLFIHSCINSFFNKIKKNTQQVLLSGHPFLLLLHCILYISLLTANVALIWNSAEYPAIKLMLFIQHDHYLKLFNWIFRLYWILRNEVKNSRRKKFCRFMLQWRFRCENGLFWDRIQENLSFRNSLKSCHSKALNFFQWLTLICCLPEGPSRTFILDKSNHMTA